ncbi:hypothetical protein, partial [Burkholderia pyrrocinia]|uniref:hypothetical protein n=1 Tax=Burkholderia pyrrocinia TaxID=60550 RepID=UPI001C2D860A
RARDGARRGARAPALRREAGLAATRARCTGVRKMPDSFAHTPRRAAHFAQRASTSGGAMPK